MLEFCIRHCLCLFLCMAVRRRDLEFGLYRWITSKGLLGIRMDRVLNAQMRELCGVKKGLDERIEEGMFQWFSHVKRMERDRIPRRVYV